MSRSGYSDDFDDYGSINLYRASVASAILGRRGQKMLRELLAALDAMPVKALVAEELVTDDGQFCALGVLGAKRGIDMSELDPEDPDAVGEAFDIARSLAAEVVYENDECGPSVWLYDDATHKNVRREPETPAERWARMRKWVADNILPEAKR